jgi:hypothetical protein
MQEKNISLKTPTANKNCIQQYAFNQKGSEESSRNVCSSDLEDNNGKEELYLRKIKKIEIWDYFSTNYEILFIQLLHQRLRPLVKRSPDHVHRYIHLHKPQSNNPLS